MTATDTTVYRRIVISFANAFKERRCLDPNCIILSITMCRHGMIPGIDATGDSPLVAYFAARTINRQVMIASKWVAMLRLRLTWVTNQHSSLWPCRQSRW